MFGHYEDADLCLKSLQKGISPWIHDVKLWHLEGKGSHRLPVHEGASIVNRWLFNKRWANTVIPTMLGQSPQIPEHQDMHPITLDERRRVSANGSRVKEKLQPKAPSEIAVELETFSSDGGEVQGGNEIELVFGAEQAAPGWKT